MTAESVWRQSRAGSNAGRGFHYQDAVATEIALEYLQAGTLQRLVPEGLEDISVESTAGSIHIQAKSRREKRGPFKLSELTGVWRHLADRLIVDPGSIAVLVLERGVEELPQLQASSAPVRIGASQPDVAATLRTPAASELNGLVLEVDEILARLSIEVRDGLPEASLRLLANRLSLPPASCQAHLSILREKIASLADANGERTIGDPAALPRTDFLRLLDEVSESVDPRALAAAVRDGICELIDFGTPINDPYFYSGVDVLPGHVAAGVVLQRPETALALDALETRRVVLVTGPSGVGKSALIWLAAFESRHRISWYRINRLGTVDVTPLIRFARGCKPTERTPLGFVADDVGREGRDGWDLLAREMGNVPNVMLMGACREEDLFTLQTAVQAEQVRPRLDETMAERLYLEVCANEATSWAGWREPYERSEGLLLEYGHLLTEGARLGETIKEQVNRRLRERRDVEVEVLRLVTTAHAYGADISAVAIANQLNRTVPELQQAMTRLLEEHLIKATHDGRLTGLHELRSAAIAREVHRLPPARLEATAAELVALLDARPLQVFLTRILADAIAPDAITDALAARINAAPNVEILSAGLQALRVAGFADTAGAWTEILRKEGVVTDAGPLAYFALSEEAPPGFLSRKAQRAVVRMREVVRGDFRPMLLGQLDSSALDGAVEGAEPVAVTVLLAALAGSRPLPTAAALAKVVDGADIHTLRQLLESAYEASPALASELAEALGGSDALLARLEEDLPWVKGVRLGKGVGIAAADYAAVAQSVQKDAHGDVVNLCRYLLAFTPTAEVARVRALDASGEVAGLEVPMADKAMPRKSLPTTAARAWNRSVGRALTRTLAASSYTERLVQERELLERSAIVVRKVAMAYLTGKNVAEALAASVDLGVASETLLPPPEGVEVAGALEPGGVNITDGVGFLSTMIPNNLVPRLFGDGPSPAPMIPLLLQQLAGLEHEERWSLLPQSPVKAVRQLGQNLRDLHAVRSEADAGGEQALRLLRAVSLRTGQHALPRAAALARQRCRGRLDARCRTLKRIVNDAGYPAGVYTRPGAPYSAYWPTDETLVLAQVSSIQQWQLSTVRLIQALAAKLEGAPPFFFAPVRVGRIVSAFALRVIGEKAFPVFGGIGQWEHLHVASFEGRATSTYRTCVDALCEVSGIVASVPRSTGGSGSGFRMHQIEAETLETATKGAREGLSAFESICAEHPQDVLLHAVLLNLVALGDRVEREADARNKGGPQWVGIAAEFVGGTRGERSDAFNAHVGAIAALTEWDIEPSGALERIEKAQVVAGTDTQDVG